MHYTVACNVFLSNAAGRKPHPDGERLACRRLTARAGLRQLRWESPTSAPFGVADGVTPVTKLTPSEEANQTRVRRIRATLARTHSVVLPLSSARPIADADPPKLPVKSQTITPLPTPYGSSVNDPSG